MINHKTILAAAGLVTALALAGSARAGGADGDVDVGAKMPSADDVKQGLFPDDDCEQLKAAGFKCMGFKPPVRFSLPATAFKVGSAELPDPVKHQLDVFADALRDRTDTERKVRVEGHADASGDAAVNQELSLRRAEAARQYLVDKGVNGNLLVAIGLGARAPKDPANPNAAENRRVVIGRDTQASQ